MGITRDRFHAADVWYLNGTSTTGRSVPAPESEEPWFIVQTNYDHWVDSPQADDRRNPGIAHMQSLGESGISHSSLYGVMATFPTLNKETVYTTTMSAKEPAFFQTTLQNNCPRIS